MRTFIALPLPAEARTLLGDLQSKLRSFDADIKWTQADSIHLTLKFLGEIAPASLPGIISHLRRETTSERTLTLRIQGLGGFPDLRSPRVIWCGLDGDLAGLATVQRKVEAACIQAGFAPEERPFQAHLTLGRVRSKRNLQALLDYTRIGNAPELTFTVPAIHVYQSTLGPQGARYTVLEKIELKDE